MRFNLSEWALANRPLVIFFMVLLAVMGVRAYTSLGQSEDPPFTFRVMVIQTYWPGASADEMDRLVTDHIEEKLLELETLDFVRSYSRPGESVITIIIRDDLPPSAMQGTPVPSSALATFEIAVICGTPTPVTTRVVQMLPGPMPTFTASAPARIRSRAPARVATFPAMTSTSKVSLTRLRAFRMPWLWPCALSSTSTSAPA